ncbi:hypothetical protein ABI59_20245 [Acidobacteria bacterium Mor1]|nr:hypothetical protein ABI59_20245 [Acidobacteria bacterium Mor1]
MVRSAASRRLAPEEPLPVGFYRRNGLTVARDLLGRTLCRRLPAGRTLRGRIVEVEAYDGFHDRASHAYRGRTPRTDVMFRSGGVAYVYLIYGMHHCLNLVSAHEGYPSAVLVRALELPDGSTAASGPGRLAREFRIDRTDDGVSLSGPSLWLEAGSPVADREVRRTGRIGVDYAGVWASARYRFLIDGHPAVSGRR